jgi:3-hydroxyisobutyrate dehydrogenase-like beta-hydroxyacid dehydrogenase
VPSVGLLHPGAMGAALGAALVGNGHEVFWASTGRSEATRARAEADGLRDVRTLDVLAECSDIVLSICPPEHAATVASDVRAAGFDGLLFDANAIAPETARAIAPTVDGGVIGGPPRVAGTTRLYLSGSRAAEVADLFTGSPLEALVLDDRIGTASALKMTYAAYTKGRAALLLALRATARANGVDRYLLDEWAISQPDLAAISDFAAASSEPKAWRWIAEMEEIASTFAAAGQPDGFHRAAAEVYRQVAAR